MKRVKRLGVAMATERISARRSWQVGDRICTLTLPRPRKGRQVGLRVQWSPSAPESLTADEWRQYRAGRDRAVQQLAGELGITALLVELR